jgi:hypothetical protein
VESWEEEEAWPHIVSAEADNTSERLRAANKIRKLKPTARLDCIGHFFKRFPWRINFSLEHFHL